METQDNDTSQNIHFSDPTVSSIKASSEKEVAHFNFLN